MWTDRNLFFGDQKQGVARRVVVIKEETIGLLFWSATNFDRTTPSLSKKNNEHHLDVSEVPS